MIFKEWIETQPEDLWGIDLASITTITQYFYYREICDEERMPVYFWRDVALFRDKYKAMLRLETADATFDPMVNKYFEGLFKSETSGNNNSRTVDSKKEENSATDTRTYLNAESYEETTNSNIEDNRSITKQFIDRKRTHEIIGSIKNRETADASLNYEKDIAGALEHTTHNDGGFVNIDERHNISGSDVNSGVDKDTTTNDTISGTTNRRAMKQAPMTASGVLSSQPGIFPDKPELAEAFINQGLYNLDFNYASEYSQDTAQQGAKNKIIKELIHGLQVGRSENGSRNHYDSHHDSGDEYRYLKTGRERNVDTETTQSYNGYKETDTDNGIEKTVNGGNIREQKETKSKKINSNHRDEKGGKSEIAGESETKSSNAGAVENMNIYTGRENLTPQEALKTAISYLQNTNIAIKWFIDKLEHNFIQIFEV